MEVESADVVFRAVAGVGCSGSLEHFRSASLMMTAVVVIVILITRQGRGVGYHLVSLM